MSVEPEGTPNRIVKGLDGIAQKGIEFQNKIDKINSTFISDPIVAENFFSLSMLMNVNMKDIPVAIDMDEVCVYNVKEEFFYTPQPR